MSRKEKGRAADKTMEKVKHSHLHGQQCKDYFNNPHHRGHRVINVLCFVRMVFL